MREELTPYNANDRLNYLCLTALELYGSNSLADLIPLLAGFESIRRTLSPNLAQAIDNLRVSGIAPASRREMEILVDRYNRHHSRNEFAVRVRDGYQEQPRDYGVTRRFQLDEDLRFRSTWTTIPPADVTEAINRLVTPLGPRARELPPTHNPLIAAEINDRQKNFSTRIEPLGFVPPDSPTHLTDHPPSPPGTIYWRDLIGTANYMDTCDREAGRQADGGRQWFSRLHDGDGKPTAELVTLGSDGLERVDGIEFVGVKHLIGLPGAGKTTLLFLIAVYLHRHGARACFLFPSIEVASSFVERLAPYGVEVGLMYGQGEMTRERHVRRFAKSMAGQNNGMGITREHIAPLFATNCALAGFAADEEEPFPHRNPPCSGLLQAGETADQKALRCALASVCGYQRAERGLAEKRLWAGHVLSLDRKVSLLYGQQHIAHFEHVARYFDVLVVDEADQAQASLDDRGTPVTKITGSGNSLWATLINDLHAASARGNNAFQAANDIPKFMNMTARFGIASDRLISRITHFPENIRVAYDKKLLTSMSLIADIFPENEFTSLEARATHYARRQTFEHIWDNAARRVAFIEEHAPVTEDDEQGENQDKPAEIEAERLIDKGAPELGVSVAELRAYYDDLIAAIRDWDARGSLGAVEGLMTVIKRTPSLQPADNDAILLHRCALLVAVSMVVLQHFGLAPHLRQMHADGYVSDNVFEGRMQKDTQAILPEALIGRLSGVRFVTTPEGNVEVEQVGFRGAPRLLAERMQLLSQHGNGLAVLMTSATSLLEPSPRFNVAYGPHYVLRRPNAGQGWADSKYMFLPQTDPRDSSRKLRFSGTSVNRQTENLKAMVDRLLRGGKAARVAVDMVHNDVQHGIPRRAGFVVNSYDQCEMLYQHITANHPTWRTKTRYVSQSTFHGATDDAALTAAEVESLGQDPEWELLIFPMAAIGRGVNIVFPVGPRASQAMIGSLYFLTRPHPRAESLELIQGIVGRATQQFDQEVYPDTASAIESLKARRYRTAGLIKHLLRRPLSASRLGEYAEPFVADQMIMILQTIGRAMRGDRPAYVYFVDAAWAPESARGMVDDASSSMLVMMQKILSDCLNHPNAAIRECYENLYLPFSVPLNAIGNLQTIDTKEDRNV
ncbi:ATP-binding protein [Microbulbifer sp.]|uniref:ATP-binding protein n=1 Tax=Microbulbifer sp. TaxID=1908541 RepID=UPI003F3555B7